VSKILIYFTTIRLELEDNL